jgi:WD40 repeat protein/serine/threonine protein kinase
MSDALVEADPSLESLVGQVADEFLSRQRQGEHPDVEEYVRRYPQAAQLLRTVLTSLALLDLSQLGGACPAATGPGDSTGTLGDFRILREVARGGMGVVYEAEQISLGRRVALKVLPFAGALDARQLQRFKNEAQAAAHLHHQNIVPVHFVGCERGVHFYAMQYIDGQTLAKLIADLRLPIADLQKKSGNDLQPPAQNANDDSQPARSDPQSAIFNLQSAMAPAAPGLEPAACLTATKPTAGLSTERSTKSPAFFRTVAHIGVQAAEALKHAHLMGVIHRDIKPANVMVDGRGNLWITDFGLAQFQTDGKLTMTGDLLGTLRYMSPEQALAKHAVIDHRTDVYSLGVTLYELLTLEPAYNGRNREEVLRQIAFDEPRPPRRLNKAIPGELETIVLKAIAKNPEERYATAQELADDLRRFLEDKPIKAKRPSLRQRAAKWARRHKTVVRAAMVVVVLAVAALAASTALIWQANEGLNRANQGLNKANEDLKQSLERERRNAYFHRIGRAEREWSANNLARMQQLLDECPEDLRGWEWHYLKRLPHGGLPSLRHSAPANSVAISPDGQRIASASRGGFVTIWDALTGQKCFPSFKAHEGPAQSVAFSPDGHLLATGGGDSTVVPPRGTVIVWDAKTGQLLHKLEGHSRGVSQVAFSPDSQRLASVSFVRMSDQMKPRGEMKIWDVTNGNLLRTVAGHEGLMNCVAFSPDGKRLATGSGDTTVQIWDAQTGEELRTFHGHSQTVACVAFSPDGRLLASGGGQGLYASEQEVKVWDAETGKELFTLRGHLGTVRGVAFSPDGRRLASASADRTVKLWDVETGKEALTLRGHLDAVWSVAFSLDGHRLVSASMDRTVRVWDATRVTGEDPNCLTLPGPGGAVSVAFHPKDQRILAAAYRDGKVRVWDLSLGKPRCFRTLLVDTMGVYNVAFSREGRWLAAASGKELKIWNATTYKELRTIPGDSTFYCVAFSPDEKQIAAAGFSNFRMPFLVRVWDVANDNPPRVLSGNTWMVRQVAFSPDGQHLASAGIDGTVRMWDVKTGKRIDIPALTPPCPSGSLAFSPDGKQLALGSNDQVVRVWDTTTWKLRHEYRDSGGVLSVAFSPDGKRLAWGSTDSTVKVWDLADGAAGGVAPSIQTLRGHTSWVLSVAFSPDGKQIASASADGTVKIWKAPPVAEPDGGEPTNQGQ